MTRINSYSVGLNLSAGGFVDGSKLARGEAKQLNTTLASIRTPAEMMERKLNLLDKALASGAIKQDVYSEATKRLTTNLKTATIAAQQSATGFHRADKALLANAKSAALAYVGFSSVSRGMNAVTKAMDEIEMTVKQSNAINETTQNVQAFQFAIKDLAEIEGPEAIGILEGMTKRIGETELGVGKAKKAFDQPASCRVVVAQRPFIQL